VETCKAKLVVSLEGQDVVYGFGELEGLALAYATIIHKA